MSHGGYVFTVTPSSAAAEWCEEKSRDLDESAAVTAVEFIVVAQFIMLVRRDVLF